MPTYQYACKQPACGHRFEAVQSFSDDPITVCPVCEGEVRKVFSAVGVVFKGSGFYRNDSREPAKSGSSSAKDSGSKDNGSKDNGSKDSGSGEKKTESSSATASSSSSSGSSGSGSSSGSASKSTTPSGSSSGSTSSAAAS